MKTLDEVIKACEIHTNPEAGRCIIDCPYHGECIHDEEIKDALHYLKAYKRVQNKIERSALGNIEDTLDKIDNPALTWEELKAMEGKPVWVEDSFDNGEWYIIECITASDRFITHDRWGDDSVFKAKDMGDVWKAYRKERE